MKLWLLGRKIAGGYDTFDSAIVAANTEDEARHIEVGDDYTWVAPDEVTAERVGTAKPGTKHGVILASFNAG